MKKLIAKFICPSSKKLAGTAAHQIAAGYNTIDPGYREKLAKYSACAKKIAYYQGKLDVIVADGIIDTDEEARIAAALEPLIDEAKKIIFD